ncbi:MAG: BlaI/MecI/CopY family transcriptional regulator [Clostridia bacterium]|nr:BlaI/MecI/CopY family transcriptional regulator [Clostridia bacterium]
MPDKYDITDAELEIMQILWEKKECSLNEIIEGLNHEVDKNKNTVKTLLRRLILKGSVKSKKTNSRDAIYVPKVSKNKFLSNQNENFLKKLYNGSTGKLLLNFVENKKVSKEELKKLIDILESED